MADLMVTEHWGEPDCHTLESYLKQGGYESLRKALSMPPDAVTGEVKKSQLRGRGGARWGGWGWSGILLKVGFAITFKN